MITLNTLWSSRQWILDCINSWLKSKFELEFCTFHRLTRRLFTLLIDRIFQYRTWRSHCWIDQLYFWNLLRSKFLNRALLFSFILSLICCHGDLRLEFSDLIHFYSSLWCIYLMGWNHFILSIRSFLPCVLRWNIEVMLFVWIPR